MVEEPEALTEEELLEQLQEEMRRIAVPDYLRHLLVSLSSLAFQKMGFTADGAADRDLPQSRMAIDAFEALSRVLADGIPEEEADLYASTLHQMRMAFVRATSAQVDGLGADEDSAGRASEAATTDTVDPEPVTPDDPGPADAPDIADDPGPAGAPDIADGADDEED
jgi:hypothetical protein